MKFNTERDLGGRPVLICGRCKARVTKLTSVGAVKGKAVCERCSKEAK